MNLALTRRHCLVHVALLAACSTASADIVTVASDSRVSSLLRAEIRGASTVYGAGVTTDYQLTILNFYSSMTVMPEVSRQFAYTEATTASGVASGHYSSTATTTTFFTYSSIGANSNTVGLVYDGSTITDGTGTYGRLLSLGEGDLHGNFDFQVSSPSSYSYLMDLYGWSDGTADNYGDAWFELWDNSLSQLVFSLSCDGTSCSLRDQSGSGLLGAGIYRLSWGTTGFSRSEDRDTESPYAVTGTKSGSIVFGHSGMLTITEVAPVPVPAAAWLLLSGLGGLGLLRRRAAN